MINLGGVVFSLSKKDQKFAIMLISRLPESDILEHF